MLQRAIKDFVGQECSAGAVVELDRSPSRVAGGVDIVLVPLGATEQHGPHLPLGTDSAIAGAVAGDVADVLADSGLTVAVAPTLNYGSSGEHQGFPGTCSIGTEALTLVLVELVRSLRNWVGRTVLVNGHGGNVEAVHRAVRQLRTEGHDVSWVTCGTPGADAHAGDTETSVLLHIDPGTVDRARCQPGNTAPLEDLVPYLRSGGVAAVSPNGVLGDPTKASATKGSLLLRRMVAEAATLILRGAPAPDGRLVAAVRADT